MPIEKPTDVTAPINQIKENYKIGRYLDLIKFISILQNEALFFCRIDKLEDKFEGTSPKLNIRHQESFYRSIYNDPQGIKTFNIDESVKKSMTERKELEEKFKKINCVCCWNKFTIESYAMWKIYSDMDKGLMITSSIEKLKESFEKTPEVIQLSEINYIDHETDLIDNPGNLTSAIIHKHKAFSFEEEIRLIHQVKDRAGFFYDWESEKIKNGKNLKVDLNVLIDEVILSPYSPEWFLEMVKDLMKKYNLKKVIKFSALK